MAPFPQLPRPASWRRTRHQRPIAARLAMMSVLLSLGLVTASTASSSAQADQSTVLFDDELRNGFGNWSWATTDARSTDQVAAGGRSIKVDYEPWTGLALGNTQGLSIEQGSVLRFSVHGGSNSTVIMNVVAMNEDLQAAGGGERIAVRGGEWQEFSIPMVELGVTGTLGGVWWQEIEGADPAAVYVDQVRIVAPGEEPLPGPRPEPPGSWALEETFDGDPSAPSQTLLPRSFEFVATHRSHPKDHFTKAYEPFLADHADDCSGPNPAVSPLPQRLVQTTQDSNGSNPDPSFFVCKNHMMSSMGGVEGYSVTSFWPRQEFNFADGGTLEFEVNINDDHGNRSWWEIMIVPRDELKVAPGPNDSPISETYPDSRIVLDFRRNARTIKVGIGALAPDGWLVNERQRTQWDWAWWRDMHPGDPALDDRRVRRTMQVRLDGNQIVWGIETADGSFDEWSVDVPGGLPFDQGLVLFKTHAYNPTKDGNLDTYTFHWDNIRFDGPLVGQYDVHEADDVVYLQRNGDRPIGDSQTVSIDLDTLGANPVLFGQIHQPKSGQVLLSINGGPNVPIVPYEYDEAGCLSTDWKSFRHELDPAQLQLGENTLTWSVGPRPNCSYPPYHWDGFSVKFLQIQTDR